MKYFQSPSALLLITLISCPASSDAQTVAARATIKHQNSTAYLAANYPRPLHQALQTIRSEYGWAVDYVDPVYSPSELVDDTAPQWRAEHPFAKGVTRVAGGKFTTSFDESDPAETVSAAGEARVLNSLVSAYNASGNPGRFEVRKTTDGRFEIVGISTASGTTLTNATSILDIPITLEVKPRKGDEAVDAILDAVTSRSGRRIYAFEIPRNVLMPLMTNIGGKDIPAHLLLAKVLEATKLPFYWDALYDADSNFYGLNISPQTKSYYDAFGNREEKLVTSPIK